MDRQLVYSVPTPNHPRLAAYGAAGEKPYLVPESPLGRSAGPKSFENVENVLQLCGLMKYRDLLLEKGYDRLEVRFFFTKSGPPKSLLASPCGAAQPQYRENPTHLTLFLYFVCAPESLHKTNLEKH